MIFRCTALLLSLAFVGAPMAADYCAASCEAAPTAAPAASGDQSGHHHRHASTAPCSISQPPQPCGHDHNGVVAVTATSDVAHARALATAGVAVSPSSLLAPSLWTSVSGLHRSNSPPGSAVRGFASPIRI